MKAIDHPPIRRLLTRLAAKARRKGATGATLSLDSTSLPELFNSGSGEEADFIWSLVEAAQAEGWFDIRVKPGFLHQAAYEHSPRAVLRYDRLPALNAALGLADVVESPHDQWKTALLAGLQAPQEVKESLFSYDFQIPGKTPGDIVEGLNRLLTLRGQTLLLREASSLAFWGISKALEHRAEMVARLYQMGSCPFEPNPLIVNLHFPPEGIYGVVFVENKTTFEVLQRSAEPGLLGMVLVFCSGYMGCAPRLRKRSQVSCYTSETSSTSTADRERMSAFLFDAEELPCYFFGDLDLAGMDILRSLRKSFPNVVAWKDGYTPMLDKLLRGHGHTAAAAGKSRQVDPVATGCPYADSVLLPALRETGRFIDQE